MRKLLILFFLIFPFHDAWAKTFNLTCEDKIWIIDTTSKTVKSNKADYIISRSVRVDNYGIRFNIGVDLLLSMSLQNPEKTFVDIEWYIREPSGHTTLYTTYTRIDENDKKLHREEARINCNLQKN